jgi:hypothetical protein
MNQGLAILFLLVVIIGAAIAALYEPHPGPYRPQDSAFTIEHRQR